MDKKYELIKENDYYRIRALKNFQLITGKVIKTGVLGGLVSGKHNLSQEGNCWISYYAKAFGDSKVIDNAVLKDYSVACGNSTVSGNAVMKDHSIAYDNSTISGNAVMKDCSYASNNSAISGNAVMKDFSWAKGDSIITGNALLQEDQHIQFGTVTTDLLGTKDLIGTLYAELGVVPNDNKIVLYKKVWRTDDESVFKSNYDRNFLYKIGKMVAVKKVDDNILNVCTSGLHFTNLEFLSDYDGDTIIECEVEVPDIVTVQGSQVRTRKCKVIRVYKEEE
ncbi:MAG: hypothetical protein BWY04_01104 [candidate division CPR1 bacterium ADurb.Bin160]|uniref:Uncharacterized protein n=1 Tax=candidate division CPR1 bacterium ADurb.Bin160 TaxID=1852826 RepID=A0A1V5ZLT5_9BACT|nr:MAG: hypothetical protein BWY04_01104 [candidate division CPR1 bacterium ADurb.Bin160]